MTNYAIADQNGYSLDRGYTDFDLAMRAAQNQANDRNEPVEVCVDLLEDGFEDGEWVYPE